MHQKRGGGGSQLQQSIESSLSSVLCVENKCHETRGMWQGPNGKGQGEVRRGTRHDKVLGKEQDKAW